jgi:hypothetical protein
MTFIILHASVEFRYQFVETDYVITHYQLY